VLTSTCLREEGVEGIVTTTDGLVRRHLTIRLNTMFEAEELPASIADLDACLSNVDAKGLTHVEICVWSARLLPYDAATTLLRNNTP